MWINSDDVRINTDQIKLKQLIINLISNSIKYTSKGKVNFSAQLDNNRLTISVSDTGAGIPSDKLSDLYKPFSRIEENNNLAYGTGLGLFVVKGIVDLFEGDIKYDSQINEGTTATIVFNVDNAKKDVPKGAKRIKVYDDDPVVLRVVSDMLSSLGHMIVNENFDLIITDMEMGDISGLDILKENPLVPVIVMKGRSDYSDNAALKDGFIGYLPKPVNKESIREMIGEGESFADFLGDDFEEIKELFKESSKEDMIKLQAALNESDFDKARAICHKMLPMFTQLGYRTDELVKIDLNKDKEYESWQTDVEKILSVTI